MWNLILKATDVDQQLVPVCLSLFLNQLRPWKVSLELNNNSIMKALYCCTWCNTTVTVSGFYCLFQDGCFLVHFSHFSQCSIVLMNLVTVSTCDEVAVISTSGQPIREAVTCGCYLWGIGQGCMDRIGKTAPQTKWPLFRRRHFQMHFNKWKALYFDSNCTEVCS